MRAVDDDDQVLAMGFLHFRSMPEGDFARGDRFGKFRAVTVATDKTEIVASSAAACIAGLMAPDIFVHRFRLNPYVGSGVFVHLGGRGVVGMA